jgi:hypothetical protein
VPRHTDKFGSKGEIDDHQEQVDVVDHTSKKCIHLGGMALSERTRSARAVRNTLVVEYSMPGLNTMRRVAYPPLIDVLQFLLALVVSNFKRML